MFKVVFYKKPNGDEPAITHLNMLLPRMRAKVLRNMSLLQRGETYSDIRKQTT